MSRPGLPLVSAYADDPEMRDLARLFVAELPERLERMAEALGSGDLETLARLVHQLKGAAGGYGFMPITEAAREVEACVRGCEDVGLLAVKVRELAALCGRATV